MLGSATRISLCSGLQNTTTRVARAPRDRRNANIETRISWISAGVSNYAREARSPTETIGGDPVRRRLVHKTRPEREQPQLDDDSEPADKYQRVEMVDYYALGLGGEQTKLTLRPPEEYDIEDDTKEIEVDDLGVTQVLQLAQNKGLNPAAVETGIRKEMKGLQDFDCIRKSLTRRSRNRVSGSLTRSW